jgi:hypothetical protein
MQPLSAPWVMKFDYTRTTGPVIGRFLAGLRERRIEGLRGADGRVVVPPTGYDPTTSERADAWVEVGTVGTVASWSWVPAPLETQPMQRPFAWALIRLDGADTNLLHVVDAGDPAGMSTGMRVRVRWADQPRGHISDIAWFEPVTDA